MAADFGISIAAKLFETIGSEVIKEVCDIWGYKTHLEELKETVSTIQKVLLDADNRRELSNTEQDYIEKLKEVLYDADDLFDEVRTLAELKQLRQQSKSGRLFDKVRCFFSSKNQLGQASKMSRDVKEIKKRLEDIANNYTKFANNNTKFGFSVDYEPIIRRREETCSYVDANEIIGREEDKVAVVDMLLDNNVDEHFSCVTIVGVGGLGKTTLAQLVFNDEKIQREFELRAWVSVSDQEGTQFDVKIILCKILESITKERFDDSSVMELVMYQLQMQLRGKKYLIVLDDIWNEECGKWVELERFLKLGQGESRVVVTTRSVSTGIIVSDKKLYHLQGLSSKKSLELFMMSAFQKGDEHENHQQFIEIGREIVKNCYNVPLALKVVGSLLRYQDISKWHAFQNSGLANIGKCDDQILSILKLSYHNLPISLKSCFSYCAVFPKGCRIEKEKLINLWMAQGYIMPLDDGQSLEDAAEDHFVILLRRCFFQDVEEDDDDIWSKKMSVKIHDLMHDVAQRVSREEIQIVTTTMKSNPGGKIRHVLHVGDSHLGSPSFRIRTLFSECLSNRMVTQIDKWKCIRALVLPELELVNLPNSIEKLLHLRYLDLSGSYLHFACYGVEVLPDAITRLHNLQTLILCNRLIEELPKDFCKLVKLRHLDLSRNLFLKCMPSAMEKLTNLKVLTWFVVGNKVLSEAQSNDELKPLQALTGIRGEIEIKIGEYYRKVESTEDHMGGTGGYLKRMEHLTMLCIEFYSNGRCNTESILETLEPPSNIKHLMIVYYNGTVIPKWGRAGDNWAINFSHLTKIHLSSCENLQEMPVLSKLRNLKNLILSELKNLEYMEISNDSQAPEFDVFFPSLVSLEIWDLKRLKGWWKGVDDAHRFFPCLSHLDISGCPELTSFPPCPSVDDMRLTDTNEALQIIVGTAGKEDENVVTTKLRHLETDVPSHLKSLPINCLTSLTLRNGKSKFDKAETMESLIEEFQRCASSLQFLCFSKMKNVRRLIGGSGLAHFTALETLRIQFTIPRLSEDEVEVDGDEDKEQVVDDDDEDNSLFSKSFPQNLRKLAFHSLEEETSLPKGVQYLTSLQTLEIRNCEKLRSLPDWIDCLSCLQSLTLIRCPAFKSIPASIKNLKSLKRLDIEGCKELIQRCQKPHGEDYPKIQHIPRIELREM